jgi:PAS domain S-box-containing protein
MNREVTLKVKFRLLFLSGSDCSFGILAKGLFSALNNNDTFVADTVTLGDTHIAPDALKVLRAEGIDDSAVGCRTLNESGDSTYDLIITLDESSREYCEADDTGDPATAAVKRPLMVGTPVHLHWAIDRRLPTAGWGQSPPDYTLIRERLHRRITTLLDDGYLSTLADQRERSRELIDVLGDGLIMHDQHRNIYLFNREAERITGYSRDSVLGQNCHEIFGPDGICGTQCSFRDGPPEHGEDREYQVRFTSKDGMNKLLRMSVTPVEAGPGGPAGVIASIRDISEISELRWKLKERKSFHGMVGASMAMQEVFQTIRQVVTSDYPVLISGESGTGKELVANAIHNEGRRSGGPFVPVNCGALPENILESELFGHVRGAFTGAIRDKKGRFELADGGTLFLDEVGELTPSFQVKLLRVIQEKRFERVGGEDQIGVDVRIISATNRNLRESIKKGKFREDLFYRICVVPIELPPLRERREDIPLLIEQILEEIRTETNNKSLTISDNAIDRLLLHKWPGNVRELINALRFSAVRCGGRRIHLKHLPPEVRTVNGTVEVPIPPVSPVYASESGDTRKKGKLDKESVQSALAEAGGNKLKAAKALGVGRATLYRFLKDHPELS